MIPYGSAPPAASGGTDARPAGLGRRWCALVYEAFLMFALLLVAGFAALPLIGPHPAGASLSARQFYLLPIASSAFLFLYYVVVAGVYCIGFWSNGRRTLAMKTWGMRLAASGGCPLDIHQATKRYLAAWIGPAAAFTASGAIGIWGLAILPLNYYWGWLDRERQFLHDRLAGTRVILD